MRKSFGLKIAAILLAVGLALPASALEMNHWAYLRDENGDVIATIDEGEEVEVLGISETDPSRSEVYYPQGGLYGSVSSVYIYGGTDEEYENPASYGLDEDSDEDSEDEDYEEDEDEDAEEEDEDEDILYSGRYMDVDEPEVGGSPDMWIEVDIDAQVLTLWQGDEVVLSADCTTGTYGICDTPTGEFTIINKTVNTTLVGTKYTGEDYARDICYWMGLTDWGIGIHDAPWKRGVLGGDVYITDGSQGCINLDVDVAATVYSLVSEGTRVVIH